MLRETLLRSSCDRIVEFFIKSVICAPAIALRKENHLYSLPHMLHCFEHFNAHRMFQDCLFRSSLSVLFLDYVLSRWNPCRTILRSIPRMLFAAFYFHTETP